MINYKLFEQIRNVKKLIGQICTNNGFKIIDITETLDVRIEGIESYDELIKDLSISLKDQLLEICTKENGRHFKINLKLNEETKSNQTVFTKSYVTGFLKRYGFVINQYSPILKEMSILVKMTGDKTNYEKMLNRLISLHYSDIEEVYTVKPGEELKIFIKNF